MEGNKKPIAFFDVDHTLCAGSSGYFTARELIRKKIIKKRRLLLAMVYRTLGPFFKDVDVRRLYEIALVDMAGTQLDEIMELGRHVFETYVKPRIFKEGLAEIEKRKKEGYLIIILSSGPYMCIENMAGYLGADFSFSNGPIIKDGILQKQIQEPIYYKEGKVQVAQELAFQQGVTLHDCLFYSDSYSDLPLLKEVGHPYVVNPDRNLLKEARKRGWPLLKFNTRLGTA